jgi:hypothetical protein
MLPKKDSKVAAQTVSSRETMFPSFTFGGEFSHLYSDFHLLHLISRYANQSMCFISAYHAGLTGSQAV